MKVLFAVNDENISTSIVKKYQKQYKEIISYKIVCYFNAILKELQRNKNYDRVVIMEEIEEFTSSSYEQKDKFIFDSLDNISDEAVTPDGNDIPIILICSERRNKSEDILVKLFGIGIYNAIIGEDRSTDEVCKLINKPRSKKEAKIYYQIDSENVTYEKEKENDVNEIELQNILRHFKRLGGNTERYAESFKNIVSQYNEAQMKVIIAILPKEVKEVLDETSTEYQKIVYPEGRATETEKRAPKKNKSRTTKTKDNAKATTEKLLKIDETKMISKPVVVPTTMDKSMYKKVNAKRQLDIDFDELEEDDDDEIYSVEKIIEQTPKKRGRQRKKDLQEETKQEVQKNKKRGRPRKNSIQEEENIILPGFEEDDEVTEIDDNEIKVANIEKNYKKQNNSYEDEYEKEQDNYDEEYEEEQDSYDEEYEEEQDSYDEEYEEEQDNYDEEYEEEQDSYDEEYEEEQDNYDEEYEEEQDNYDEEYEEEQDNYNVKYEKNNEKNEEIEQYDNVFKDGEIESLLAGNKKIVSFVGTSKNGTSFIVNNVAQILASIGINTAILDATQNKNSYYIYTKNDEGLRAIATQSIQKLTSGEPKGISVKNNLTVYTGFPNKKDEIKNSRPIIETLLKNYSIILIDCDFETPIEYFEKSQELYLIQSMDVLTIQPLTEFLRELQIKNVLDQSKIRIILNKLLKIRRVNGNTIIGGMSKYNNPDLSLMKDLFNAKTVKTVAQIPFDEDVYAKYLEGLIECEIKLNGYPKDFRNRLNNLAENIYPLLPNKGINKKNKKQEYNQYSNSFSFDMNSTLDNMRKKY